MNKISIIIPAYNSAAFIGETLENIINQNFDDLEVIVVNDGSADNTADVVRSYAEKHPFIRLIEKENGGVSSARNLGIEQATGKYICFQDADDLYAPGSLKALWDRAEATQADLLIFRLRNFSTDGLGKFNPHCDNIAKKDELDPFDLELLWVFLVSNKFYLRKRLIESKVRFPSSKFSEEGAFFISYVLTRPKIAGCFDAVALYRRHSAAEGLSVSQTVTLSNAQSFCDSMQIIYSAAEKATEGMNEEQRAVYLGEILYKKAYVLLDQFYRPMWRGEDDCVDFCAGQLTDLLGKMPENRKIIMLAADSDVLRLPLPTSKTEAAAKPGTSIILKPSKSDASAFISGMYEQTCPLFELFVPRSYADRCDLPSTALNAENFHILPDEGFVKAAKEAAKGRIVVFSRPVRLDKRMLRLTHKLKNRLPAALVDIFFPIFAKGVNFSLVRGILK